MAKKKQKQHNHLFWLAVGAVAALLTAPNMTILKVLVGDIDPLLVNVLRSGIIVAVSLPFIIGAARRFTRKNLRYALLTGAYMAVAITATIYALKYSQASYVVILTLITPIVLVLYSHRMIGEQINVRAAAGITVAATGAFVAVALPIALSGGSVFEFYPLATLLVLINCLTFPLGVIYSRKSHEAGLPLTAVYGISSLVILVVSSAAMLIAHGSMPAVGELSVNTWLGILYSAIIVAFVARILTVASYEKVGSVTTGGLSYAHTIVAILIPVFVLGEQLSLAMVIGGLLILLGVYLTERHQLKGHYRHFHFSRHH